MNRLTKLKKDYNTTQIPSELGDVVNDAIHQANISRKKRLFVKQWIIGTVAVAVLFISSINISPSFAQTIANVPMLGSLVEVFTIQQVTVREGNHQADLKVPALVGLNDEQLQTSLNKKYLEENKALFEQFQQDVEKMEGGDVGHLGVQSGYEILTDTDQLLSIVRYEATSVGSSFMIAKYDTVDKLNSILITLPSLFKDDRYIDDISSYIVNEMRKQMATDENIIYFLAEEGLEGFEQITSDQPFYITEDHKLAISFHKYEIAPGSMGVVTFEIPTDVIKNLLVSDTYIQ